MMENRKRALIGSKVEKWKYFINRILLSRNDLISTDQKILKKFVLGIFPRPILTLLLQKQAHPSTANKGIWTRKPYPLNYFYRLSLPASLPANSDLQKLHNLRIRFFNTALIAS